MTTMQSELERRQQELEAKAAELAAREEALRQGEGEFRRQHNWPPLPSFCPIKPCFFQDINVDIRPEFQKTVQLGYQLWIGFIFMLLLNLFGSIVLMINAENTVSFFTFSLMTLVFFVPLTYMSWFRPLYKAFKNDSSFNFIIFFIIFGIQIFLTGYWALGLQDGPIGLFVATHFMKSGALLAIFLFIIAACWGIYSAACGLYMVKVHSIYRSSGASMAKARDEFTKGVVTNQYVQQTVANAARQTINQTFSGTTPPAPTTSNNNAPLNPQQPVVIG